MRLLFLEIRHTINIWRTERLEARIERLHRRQTAMRRRVMWDADSMAYLRRNSGWEYAATITIALIAIGAVFFVIGGTIANLLTK